MTSSKGSVIVAGVGPGLGLAIARRFAREQFGVLMVARDQARVAAFAATDPAHLSGFAADLTSPSAVEAAVSEAERRHGPLEVAVFNAATWRTGSVLDLTPEDFEDSWRVGALAGLLVGQSAARRMITRGRGTMLFTGATASRRGGSGFANFASHKFALRGLAETMARELGPRGIHVAHVIVDGQVRGSGDTDSGEGRAPDSLLAPDAVAEAYWQLHQQHRSAWSSELELRPWTERF